MSDEVVARNGRMSAEDAEEYTASLGQALGGNWRMTALAVRLGVPEALGITTEQWIERLGGHVKMAVADRREAARELKEQYDWSTREIGAVLGVSHATVENDLNAGKNLPNVQGEPSADADDSGGSGKFLPRESATEIGSDSAPLLAIVDLETGEIVPEIDREPPSGDVPQMREMSDEERAFDRLVSLSLITRMDPVATAEAALRYRSGSAQAMAARSGAVLGWYEAFFRALQERLAAPMRRVK